MRRPTPSARTRRVSCAVLLCAVTRPWPRGLDGRPPSSRCCAPLVAATPARAARARSVGRRIRDGSALGRRSMRRPAPPALNAEQLRRAPLRGHTPVATTARRPPVAESLLLAARSGDARARFSRSLSQPPHSRRLGTRPPLDAAAVTTCRERGAPLEPCSSARVHSAAPARRPTAVESLLLAARRGNALACCSRLLGRPPHSRRHDTWPPFDAAAFASCAEHAASFAPCFSKRSHARDRDGSTAARRRLGAARRSSRRRSRTLAAPARLVPALATAIHSAAARCGGLCLLHSPQRASCAVLLRAVTRTWPRRLAGRRRRVAAARRSSRRRSRMLIAPARSTAAFATAQHSAAG